MKKHDVGQNNSEKAWIYMACYWSVAHWLGLKLGYWERMFQWKSLVSPWHGIAFVTTLECQRRFLARFDRYGRKSNVLATVLFGMGNGFYEIIYFLCAYDFGRHYLKQRLGLSDELAIFAGYTMYSFYNAFIHAFFWLPMVFPKHTKPDAPPFHTHALPLLNIVSVVWLGIYETQDNIAFICFLHAIYDGWAAWDIGLQGLSFRKMHLIAMASRTVQ